MTLRGNEDLGFSSVRICSGPKMLKGSSTLGCSHACKEGVGVQGIEITQSSPSLGVCSLGPHTLPPPHHLLHSAFPQGITTSTPTRAALGMLSWPSVTSRQMLRPAYPLCTTRYSPRPHLQPRCRGGCRRTVMLVPCCCDCCHCREWWQQFGVRMVVPHPHATGWMHTSIGLELVGVDLAVLPSLAGTV